MAMPLVVVDRICLMTGVTFDAGFPVRGGSMVYSPTQFQKGLSMPAFLERYGTEDRCVSALFKARWPKGFECPECGGREHCLLMSRRL